MTEGLHIQFVNLLFYIVYMYVTLYIDIILSTKKMCICIHLHIYCRHILYSIYFIYSFFFLHMYHGIHPHGHSINHSP